MGGGWLKTRRSLLFSTSLVVFSPAKGVLLWLQQATAICMLIQSRYTEW